MKKKISLVLLSLIMLVNLTTINVQAGNYVVEEKNPNGIGDINIISTPNITVEQAQDWARRVTNGRATEAFISLAPLYKKYSESRGKINWAIAYVQAAKETGYGQFGGVLTEEYYNPCGLKNPIGGNDYDPNAHKKFDNWDQGVIAHLDHLALYAGSAGYPKAIYVDRYKDAALGENETYDPRHSTGWYPSLYGTAPTINSLGGNQKWNSNIIYGVDLFRMYCQLTNTKYVEAKSNLETIKEDQVIEGNNLFIKGWALHAFGIKEVKVLLDGEKLEDPEVGMLRADVNREYPEYFNSINSGFEKTYDISNMSKGKKVLTIEIIARDGSVQRITRNITLKENEVEKPNLEPRSNLDLPKEGETAAGNILQIGGWALHSTGIKQVKVSIDGKYISDAKLGGTRVDVNNAYPGYPNGDKSGFNANIDISNISNGTKKVKIEIIANDNSVQAYERTIKVNKPNLEPRSNLDLPKEGETAAGNILQIGGWALHSTGIKQVKVSIDGKYISDAKLGGTRVDVNNAYPGYPNGDKSGFNANIDISNISNGTKKVKIEIIANDNSVQAYERTIKVNKPNLEPRSNLDLPKEGETAAGNILQIGGWALHSTGIKQVKVSIDGKYISDAKLGGTRVDVNNAYPGYPNGDKSGFNANIDISNISNGTKKVKIEIIANDNSVQAYERTIKVNKPNLEPRSNLDLPKEGETAAGNILQIGGWALHSTGIKQVKVSIDGKYISDAKLGGTRVDVNNAYPGYPNGDKSGFNANIDISNISNGTKKVKIEIIANDNSVQSYERTIKVNKPVLVARNWLDKPDSGIITENKFQVAGWALHSSGIKKVNIYLDNILVSNAKIGITRNDVNNAYPGYPNGDKSGFEAIIDISLIQAGNKKLSVEIVANDNTVQKIERDIVIRKRTLVVVDPGHEIESVDPGASAIHNGIRYVEGNLNLQIAVKLKAQLEARGIEVYMTRYDGLIIDKDSTESLKKRVKVANEMDADLFVSVHHNSYTSPSAHGFEVYYSTGTPVSTNMVARGLITKDGRDLTLERRSYTARNVEEKAKVSKALATTITNEGSSNLGLYNRGAKDSNLYVCKNTLMPSILIENGFLTNPTEAVKVSTPEHQQKLAEIIANNIKSIFN